MSRRGFLVGLVLAGAPFVARAQSGRSQVRIGWLVPTTGPRAGIREALRELGWVEGTTAVFVVRQAEGRRERLPELARELVRSNVDVIVATAPAAIRAAMQATSTVPIVMAYWGGSDLVQSGVIASFARPGGNVTGVHMLLQALDAKRLELLAQAVPTARKVAVLIHGRTLFEPQLPPVQEAARAAGLELHVVDTVETQGYDGAFEVITRARADALLVMASPDFTRDRQRIIELASRWRVPAIHDWGDTAREGALIAYGATFPELDRLAAGFVDRILRGARPGDLPVAQPTTFELVINARTARTLGLTIPPSLLIRADQILE